LTDFEQHVEDMAASRLVGDQQPRQVAGGIGMALDSALKRSVALKVLPHEKAANPTLVKRFNAEAQSAANLRHDNIVMIYEAGEADGLLYIALEYVEGTDVARLVQKRGTLPIKRSIEIVRQMALALQHGLPSCSFVPGFVQQGGLLAYANDLAEIARLVVDTVDRILRGASPALLPVQPRYIGGCRSCRANPSSSSYRAGLPRIRPRRWSAN